MTSTTSELGLAFRLGGILAEMLVQVGDKVEARQVLGHLEEVGARAQVAQADLRLVTLKCV